MADRCDVDEGSAAAPVDCFRPGRPDGRRGRDGMMVGITLAPEQIRNAPPEVRHWLEQQVAQTLALRGMEAPLAIPPHLVACTPEQVAAILAQITGMLPAVAVFLELGREPAGATPDGLRVLRLADIARHARLPTLDLVLESLGVIDAALRRATGDAEATLYVLDREGHCFVAEATARSIVAVWQGILRGGPPSPPVAPSPPQVAAPFAAPAQ